MSFLTPRLFAIAKMVDIDDVVADVGTDHGYLPIYLAKDNKAKKIIACDINEKPLEVARHNASSFGVSEKIELVLSDGLAWTIDNNEIHIDECIIAGMGSNTILDILKNDSKKVDGYIISPNTSVLPIRKWVKDNKYFIEDEVVVIDNDIFYEIIKVNKFAGQKIKNKKDLIFGPILWKNPNNIFIEYWTSELDKLFNTIGKIPNGEKKRIDMMKKYKKINKFINKEFKKNEESKG